LKVLFTSPILEYPAAGGPQLRIETSIRALAMISDLHVISRASRRQIGGIQGESYYRKICPNFKYPPLINTFENFPLFRKPISFLRRHFQIIDAAYLLWYAKKNNIDVVWFGFGNISYYLIKNFRKLSKNTKIVCDTDSVWSRFILRALPVVKNSDRRKQILNDGKKKEVEEFLLSELSDLTTAVSEVDAEYYRGLVFDQSKIQIFSNVIDVERYKENQEQPKGFKKPCIHLAGSFGVDSPMEWAARWFIEKAYPAIKREIPEITLYIVGRDSDKVLSDITDKSIVVTGRVHSVLPYLKNSDVAVVPLSFESGTRFKILEAGAAEVPIVSTTLGAEGIPVIHEQSILIADDETSFANEVIRVIKDKDLAKSLTTQCAEIINSRYSVKALASEGESVLKILNEAKCK
jgi:glycosyltransferase involved in cell wall biosynthesis